MGNTLNAGKRKILGIDSGSSGSNARPTAVQLLVVLYYGPLFAIVFTLTAVLKRLPARLETQARFFR